MLNWTVVASSRYMFPQSVDEIDEVENNFDLSRLIFSKVRLSSRIYVY